MFPTFTSDSSGDLPLPLVVSQQWKFPLQYYLIENQYWFAIQDWIAGLVESDHETASKRWERLKRKNILGNSGNIIDLPYFATNKKFFQRCFADEQLLLAILANIRIIGKACVRLVQIRNFLAKKYPTLAFLSVHYEQKSAITELEIQSCLVSLIQQSEGINVKEYLPLPSGRIIDVFISLPQNLPRIIECKAELNKRIFYGAIGQAMLYATEFHIETGIKPITTIAALRSDRSQYYLDACSLMGIDFWEIDLDTFVILKSSTI